MATASQMETKQRPWWLTLITGILLVIVGGIMLWGNLAGKVETYMILVVTLGIFWLIEGIFEIVAIFIDHSMWGWKLFMGIISIAAGFYIMSYPVISAMVLPKILVLVLGIWGLMYGIVLLIMAFRGGGWGAGILGALGIIFGIAMMVNYAAPGMGLAMVWSASILAFIGGFVMIFQAFKQRSD